MWHASPSCRLTLPDALRALTLVIGLGSGLGACNSPVSPGIVQFQVHATPPPDDVSLSPLTDPRVTAIELRDAQTDQLIAHSRFDPTPAGTAPMIDLDLGSIPISDPRDLRMLALGAAGQQVLGLALHRQVSWGYGATTPISLELRRPLFFFGGSLKLVAPTMPVDMMGKAEPFFAPNQQMFAPLKDESKLRVLDPNSIQPLLSSYDSQLDAPGGNTQPVTAAAGTFDGQSLLAASLVNKLHVVDTLRLEDTTSISLNDSFPVQSIVVDPMDHSAVLLHYLRPPASSGRSGHIIFVRDLLGLRNRTGDGQLVGVDIDASTTSPVGVPLSAAYAPDGLVDVVIGAPPVDLRQPDCNMLSGNGKGALRRYDPTTGMQVTQTAIPYTTTVAYTTDGERVLVQPCVTAAGAHRPGQVVIAKKDGDLVLAAPGTADLAIVGNALISVGAEDIADSSSVQMRAAVRILEPSKTTWSTSTIDLPSWQIPWVVTIGTPHAVDILFAPTDVLAYGISVTPDRARALVLLRVTHRTYPSSYGLYLFSDSTNTKDCYIQWAGYTYHILLVNLQSGAREQDYIVGVQNQSCTATLRNSSGTDLGQACFAPCDSAYYNPYLLGYQDGYIPSAASVLFGRR